MTIDLPKLYRHQRDVMNGLLSHWKGSFHVIKSRRLCGKSIIAEIVMMHTGITRERSKSYLISPSFAQADKILNEIIEMCKGKPFYKKSNSMRRLVFFRNGSEIRVFSAEQGEENLRGYTCDLLIIDECAYISDAIIDCILPYVNVSNGPVLMFSTPAAKAGRFYEYYIQGESPVMNNIFSYDWTKYDMSMLLSNERLEMYRKTMDPLKFKTDYLGLFLDNESQFFGNYSACIAERKPWVDPGEVPVVFGIDWAGSTGGDYTSIAIIGFGLISGFGNVLYDIVYFNDKDPNQTLNEVERLVRLWKPKRVTVEQNSIGNIYYGLLRDRLKTMNIPLVPFITTNESKDKIISKLQVSLQNEKIKLFKEPELLTELSEYEMTYSKTGKRVFNAKTGFHDDLIMSLAIGLNSITSGLYSVA